MSLVYEVAWLNWWVEAVTSSHAVVLSYLIFVTLFIHRQKNAKGNEILGPFETGMNSRTEKTHSALQILKFTSLDQQVQKQMFLTCPSHESWSIQMGFVTQF